MSTDNRYYVVLPGGKQESALGLAFQSWLPSQVGTKLA
jgi:LysR family transcriptional regulator, glycine cleavage system transcriptional activator